VSDATTPSLARIRVQGSSRPSPRISSPTIKDTHYAHKAKRNCTSNRLTNKKNYKSLEILFWKAKESRAREGGRSVFSEFLRVGCSPLFVAIETEHPMLSHSNFYVQNTANLTASSTSINYSLTPQEFTLIIPETPAASRISQTADTR
jgi:hypothetical protein